MALKPHSLRLPGSTPIGTLDAHRPARVDPRGLVTTGHGGWALDWWIGADDRWHVPSREATVRQRLLDNAPVVETVLRVPGGEAIHRAYAVRAAHGDQHEVVVVEIENASTIPFAVAVAVGPTPGGGTDTGSGAVGSIDLHDAMVVIDGRPALLLPRAPRRTAAATATSSAVERGCAQVVLAGEATEGWDGPVRCERGEAQAAFLFPLAHRATLRVVVSMDGAALRLPDGVLPSAIQVAQGWQAQAQRGLQVGLPASRLADAFMANRNYLLLDRASVDSASGEAPWIVAALAQCGYRDESDEVLGALLDQPAWRGPGRSLRRELRRIFSVPSSRDRWRAPAAPQTSPAAHDLVSALEAIHHADPAGWKLLANTLDDASSTYTWPASHRAVAAVFVVVVRAMLVHQPSVEELAVCSVFPEHWRGEAVEIHGAPTTLGELSFALRWHGLRPALLWELKPHEGVDADVDRLRITAPGLDPTWESAETAGDALLKVPT